MAVKLHRSLCAMGEDPGDPRRKAKALDDAGVDDEVIKGPLRNRGEVLERLSGQGKYPVIEFEEWPSRIVRVKGHVEAESRPWQALRLRRGNA